MAPPALFTDGRPIKQLPWELNSARGQRVASHVAPLSRTSEQAGFGSWRLRGMQKQLCAAVEGNKLDEVRKLL